MSSSHLTHDEIHRKLYHAFSTMPESKRHEIEIIVDKLSDDSLWTQDAMHHHLAELVSANVITEHERHTVEETFFSE
jgi:hypothetical protein